MRIISEKSHGKEARIPSREELVKLLSRCHEIIRNNDKLSPEVAFDVMSRILFARMTSERRGAPIELDSDIGLKESSISAILSALDAYDLSGMPEDVKGIAFEQLLGRSFRGELGQFFTPRTVVDFMIGVLDPCEGEFICDPCCGSGGFLIRTLDYLSEKLECRDDRERRKRIGNAVFGTDANPRMARTAQMNMTVHGGSPSSIYHHDGLINVGGIFEGRFDVILTNPPFGASVSRDQTIELQDLERDPEKIAKYTAVYGSDYRDQLTDLVRRASGVDKDGKCDERERLLLGLYETGKMSTLTEVLFIERCLRLLKPGGRMGIVLPEGVLNNSNLQRVREYVEGKARLTFICSIPPDTFASSGAGVKSSIVFLRKFTDAEVATVEQVHRDMETLCGKENASHAECRRAVREKLDYEIPLASVSHTGITTGGRECENELEGLLAELRSGDSAGRIKAVNFKDMQNWSIASNLINSECSSAFPLVRIGDLLVRVKQEIDIEDGALYKRPTIKGNNGGIVLRDIARGEKIGTKKQYTISAGQLLISKIDARNGAFGIVPDELDGGVITGNFWTFDVNTELIYPEVLCAILSCDRLRDIWESCSSGTTNRHYLQERDFLNMSIPVPPFSVQRAFIDELSALRAQVDALERRIELAKRDFDAAIFE